MIADCSLCQPDLAPILMISTSMISTSWRLVLNHNQNLLGKCFLSLNRHLEPVTELTADEWMDLHLQLQRVTHALKAAFNPDHFNYAFLQNQDRHIHMHLIPRYADQCIFAGEIFDDPDYPSHYAVPSPARHLTTEQLSALASYLREHLVPSSVL